MQKVSRRQNKGLLYILPWLAGFCLLQLYPFVCSLYYSFTSYSGVGIPKLVWFANYIALFTTDSEFWNSLKVTCVYTLITVPGKLLLSLFIAMLMNQNIKGIGVFRTLYYIPSLFAGSIAVAILWKLMFMDDGIINSLLGNIGIGPVSWLGDKRTALITICLLEIWQFGSSMILFLAALKNVPQELYEAAWMDGAGNVRCFFSITIPQITPIILFNVINQSISALQNFTYASVITNGGPLKSTNVLALKLYKEAFAYQKYGYASALSWIMFLIILVITALLFRSSSAWVYYEDGGDF